MRLFQLAITAAVVAASSVLAAADSTAVLDLTKDKDFNAAVGKSKGALVEFFAPWCGHCKKLAPTWDELADSFKSKADSVIIGKVDADNNRALGQRFGVKGFPTLMWFKPNSIEPETYMGPRDLNSLQKYVEEMTGKKAQAPPKLPPKAVQLTKDNFESIVMDPKKNVLVEFYAPWCGYCKQVAPIVEKVAYAFENEDDCVVAQLDADNAEHKEIASRFGIASFPTFKMFGRNDKAGTPYDRPSESDKVEEHMIDYLNKQCMTHRTVGGSLTELGGRMPLLDILASRFFMAKESAEKTSIREEADKFVQKAMNSANATEAKNVAAQYYLKVMGKALDQPTYLEKETKRLAGLVKKHVDGTSVLTTRKFDEIKRRANILASFAFREMSDKAKEASQKAAQGIGKDEL